MQAPASAPFIPDSGEQTRAIAPLFRLFEQLDVIDVVQYFTQNEI